jgi:hypothetical protein
MEADNTHTVSGRVYTRAAVDEYLERAAAANEQLRALIEQAHARRATAQRVAQQAKVLNAGSAIHDLQGELWRRRGEVEEQAAEMVLGAQQRAADVLRAARDDACDLLLRNDMVVDLPEDVEIDLTQLASEPTGTVPGPVFEPAVIAAPGNGSSGNGSSGNGSSANGASGNGSSGNGSSVNGHGTPEQRFSGLAGLLRRSRRELEQVEEADDEFLEFLRGALLEEGPLGPSPDAGA